MTNLDGLKRHYSEFSSDLTKLKGRVSFLVSLRRFFRDRITLAQAQDEIKKLLDSRTERFLELARTQIYERPASPYLRLLKIAGCQFSDLRAQVHTHGLENTLEQLAGEGVYLTSEEFKGKKEVVRRGDSFKLSGDDFQPWQASSGYVVQTSGTRNQAVRSTVSLDWLALRARAIAVFFSAHGLFSYSHAMYDAILPGSGGVNNLLFYAKLGISTERWFARKIPVHTRLEAQYHYWMTRLIVFMGQRFGPGFPKPELIDLQDIHRIVGWAAEKRRARKPCSIACAASNGARVARVALEMGESLEGLKFNVSGEPLTDAKQELMERTGASVTSRFSYGAGMTTGYGCGNPAYTGETHIVQHMLALVSHPRPLAGDGPPIHPLLCTTLDFSAPALLLNVESGDYGTLERRDCGCALEKAGLSLHLHDIRSFEKFATEGMNYAFADLFHLVEKALPSEFGGGVGDYQLVE